MGGRKPLCEKQDYFKTWSPNMAYLLGLWFADGTVSSSQNYIALALQKDDRKLIEWVQHELQYKGKLIQDKNNIKLSIGSKELHTDLMELGCIPRKSYVCSAPNGVPEELIPHFVRGYFDGDGCATTNRSDKRTYLEIKMLGTKTMIEWLDKNIPFKHSSIKQRTEVCWEIVYFNKEAKQLSGWMYKEGICLQRKKERVETIGIEFSNNELHASHYTEKEDKLLEEYYPTMSATKVAEKLGRTKRSVEHRIRKLGIQKG